MGDYTQDEWSTMLTTPLWTFAAVAGMDDEITEDEWETLGNGLRNAHKFENPVTRGVFKDLRKDFDEIVEEWADDDTELGDALSAIADIVEEKEDEETATRFKADMIVLAVMVSREGDAESNDEMDEDEAEAIGFIAGALRLDEDVLWAVLKEMDVI